jgi:hypothetical protein
MKSWQQTFADELSGFVEGPLPSSAADTNSDPQSPFVFLAPSLEATGDKTKPHLTLQIAGRETKPAGKIAWVDKPVAVLVTIEAHRRYPSQGGNGCGVSAILPQRPTA